MAGAAKTLNSIKILEDSTYIKIYPKEGRHENEIVENKSYNAMQCNAMQCNATQRNATQCNAMQCNTTQYAMRCNAI